MDEYKLLIHVLEFCEENGNRHSNVHFDVDHKLVEELYDRYGVQPSIDELKQIEGMGVATSKRKSEELRKNRPLPKKVSDYIEDHKGLFVLLGSCIALAGLIISFLAKGSGNG